MPKWVWWGGVLALALLLRKSEMTVRVMWKDSAGAGKSRDFAKQDVAKAFADTMIAAGARDVQISPVT
jgi:hypothetical protein